MVIPARVSSLSDARLTAPRPSVELTRRDRVIAILDGAVRDHPLTLVTAGAGSGKTLALASWVTEGHPPGPVAWVSVDRDIRTPERLWAAIVLAVERALGPLVIRRLGPPDAVDGAFVSGFAAALDGVDACLILDDVHEIADPRTWESLDRLVAALPPGLRLVLSSRHDPPLALNHLRLDGRLADVRGAHLAFTEDEAVTLLGDLEIMLSRGDLHQLMATTEGWAAGLRLALMTIRASGDPESAVREFDGSQPLVAGYLVEEVVRRLEPALGEFLLHTSVADRVCAPLARALTGDPTADSRLQDLARDNAMVVELTDSGWYRYHPLLLQMLRSWLRATDPDLERELHRTASLWHEASGEWAAALDHALRTEDWDHAVLVLLRSASVMVFSSDRPLLGELIGRMPPHLAEGRPERQVALALAAFCRRDFEADAALRTSAEPALGSLPEPVGTLALLNLRVLEAVAGQREGDAGAITRSAEDAAALAASLTPGQAPGWFAYRNTPLGLVGLGALWKAEPRHTLATFLAPTFAPPELRRGFAAVYAGSTVALAHWVAGELQTARTLALATIAEAERTGPVIRHESGAAWLALALAEFQRGDTAAAGRAVEHGLEAADRGPDPLVRAGLRVADAYRSLQTGDLAGARQRLADVAAHLTAHPGMPLVEAMATIGRVEVELAARAPARARAALAAHPETAVAPGEPDLLAVARARVHLARGAAGDALLAAEPLLGWGGTLGAEAWLVSGLARAKSGLDDAAVEAVTHALDLAAPEEARGLFLRPYEDLGPLLRRHLELVGTHREFVTSLVPALDPSPAVAGDLLELLTDRELSVLGYLPTMSSNTEIAASLGISVNTVKQHLKSINRKLGVTSRRESVRVARTLGLLPERH